MKLIGLLLVLTLASGSTVAAGGGKSLGDVETTDYKSVSVYVDREQFALSHVKGYHGKSEQNVQVCENESKHPVKERNV